MMIHMINIILIIYFIKKIFLKNNRFQFKFLRKKSIWLIHCNLFIILVNFKILK